ncbi:MAG: P-II family nitrogen regulator [Ignavibacteria bacterium]|jgi:nitrogen regulatory protein P-II 1
MKKIEAIIRPHKVEELHETLREAGFAGITVTEVRGYGRQKGHKEIYRGTEYNIEFVPKAKIEVFCTDENAEKIIKIIIECCKSGKTGDGKIFVSSVEDAIRIRTEESGDSAI